MKNLFLSALFCAACCVLAVSQSISVSTNGEALVISPGGTNAPVHYTKPQLRSIEGQLTNQIQQLQFQLASRVYDLEQVRIYLRHAEQWGVKEPSPVLPTPTNSVASTNAPTK